MRRIEFVEAKTRKEADEKAPWAEAMINREGGFIAFESDDDYYWHLNNI